MGPFLVVLPEGATEISPNEPVYLTGHPSRVQYINHAAVEQVRSGLSLSLSLIPSLILSLSLTHTHTPT